MNAAACHNIIVDCLISHSDWIFPGGKSQILNSNLIYFHNLLIKIFKL